MSKYDSQIAANKKASTRQSLDGKDMKPRYIKAKGTGNYRTTNPTQGKRVF